MIAIADEDRQEILNEIYSKIHSDLATDADYEMLYFMDAPII